MSAELIERLRASAIEIANAGHAGWGNVYTDAANAISQLIDDKRLMHNGQLDLVARIAGLEEDRDEWKKATEAAIRIAERKQIELEAKAPPMSRDVMRMALDALEVAREAFEAWGNGNVKNDFAIAALRQALAAPVVAPLSDDAIYKLWMAAEPDDFRSASLCFARAIEAAHGITEAAQGAQEESK